MNTCGSCKNYTPNSAIPSKAQHEGGICRLSPPPQPSVDKDVDTCSHWSLADEVAFVAQ